MLLSPKPQRVAQVTRLDGDLVRLALVIVPSGYNNNETQRLLRRCSGVEQADDVLHIGRHYVIHKGGVGLKAARGWSKLEETAHATGMVVRIVEETAITTPKRRSTSYSAQQHQHHNVPAETTIVAVQWRGKTLVGDTKHVLHRLERGVW